MSVSRQRLTRGGESLTDSINRQPDSLLPNALPQLGGNESVRSFCRPAGHYYVGLAHSYLCIRFTHRDNGVDESTN